MKLSTPLVARKLTKLGYIPAFDGLRGIAILSVMLFHAQIPLFNGGFIGVDLFFVLSGFLITTLLINEYDQFGSINLKNFYIRRILRLTPAFLVMLIVFCLLSAITLNQENAHHNYIDALISLAYLSNWARAFAIHPSDLLGHTWSLSTEEQFYIIWPIILSSLLKISKNKMQIALFSAGIALLSWFLRINLSLNGAMLDRIYNGLDTRADSLMVGCTLGIVISSGLWSKNNQWPTSNRPLAYFAPIAALGLLSFVSWDALYNPELLIFIGLFLIAVLTAVLIINIIINPESPVNKFLTIKPLVWIGSISYGLYLWHYPIFRVIARLDISSSLTKATLSFLLTFVIASASYYILERPILKFKKHFSRFPQPINAD